MISFFFHMTGITPFVFRIRFWTRKQILIVLYHHVGPPQDPFEPAVSAGCFERQMHFLREHFQVVSLAEALRIKDEKLATPRPLAVITFDDGYRDNLETAYPILKKHDLPAAFFLAAGSIGNREPMWTSRVETMFRNALPQSLRLQTVSPPQGYVLGNPESRMKVCYQIKSHMKRVPDAQRVMILEELEEKVKISDQEKAGADSEMLSWEEVRVLSRDPLVTLGSHSVSHRMLANLPPSEAEIEMRESREKIESEIGRPVLFFSYPGNSHNLELQKAARRAGYQAALMVEQCLNSFQEDDYALKRIHVEEEPLHVLKGEISGVLPWLRSMPARGLFKKGGETDERKRLE